MNYIDFLMAKSENAQPVGFDVADADINQMLFPFQRAIVRWLCKVGKAAIFADCGLGKTPMQLEWARLAHEHTGADGLIVCPLAVAGQTAREALKFGESVTVVRQDSDVARGINVVNYEMLHALDLSRFGFVVLDESSILKNFMGKTRTALIDGFRHCAHALCCTATPSPNDHVELANHSEFLGVMPTQEMLARWFINDLGNTGDWRLKRHGEADFWRWVSSWAVSLTHPRDIGFEQDGYDLPDLEIETHVIDTVKGNAPGSLFHDIGLSATSIHEELRRTAEARARRAADLVNSSDEAWVVWCNADYEQDHIARMIPGCSDVRGSMPAKQKEDALRAFSDGETRVMVTKPSIAGWGLNWQHVRNVAFVGLSYSFEQYYQALRRTWRFGQTREVRCHVIVADTETQIMENVKQKMAKHEEMHRKMAEMSRPLEIQPMARRSERPPGESESGDGWTVANDDCVEWIKTVETGTVGLSVFSPPFSSLYVYSDSQRDMGNARDDDEFFEHYRFLAEELLRVTMPGRLCVVHCSDLPRFKFRDGRTGMKDFPGDIVRVMESCGWQYHSRVTIWKDPVAEMQRTKSHRLLYKTLLKDSASSAQGMPDYLCVFRKWGEDNPEPVSHTKDDFSLDQWQQWASPVWMDVDQTRTLNARIARGDKDEKHLCPLQLDVIERCIGLWSNPGDLVLSPFMGIGSEGVCAIGLGRRFIGCELKPEYFRHAVGNLRAEASSTDLFSIDSTEPAA